MHRTNNSRVAILEIRMAFNHSIPREVRKILLEIGISPTGFLLALAINSWIEHRHDDNKFNSILTSIKTEARSNRDTLGRAKAKYSSGGVLLREFSAASVNQALSDPLFVGIASRQDLDALSEYGRTMVLLSGYRRANETVFELASSSSGKEWLKNIDGDALLALDQLSTELTAIEGNSIAKRLT
jgi:hypothetical protein